MAFCAVKRTFCCCRFVSQSKEAKERRDEEKDGHDHKGEDERVDASVLFLPLCCRVEGQSGVAKLVVDLERFHSSCLADSMEQSVQRDLSSSRRDCLCANGSLSSNVKTCPHGLSQTAIISCGLSGGRISRNGSAQ